MPRPAAAIGVFDTSITGRRQGTGRRIYEIAVVYDSDAQQTSVPSTYQWSNGQ